jgi:hypothetical protein
MTKARTLVTAAISFATLAMAGCDDSTDIDREFFEAALTSGAVIPVPAVATTASAGANLALSGNLLLNITLNVSGGALTSAVTSASINGPADALGVADVILDLTPALAGVIASGQLSGVLLNGLFNLATLPVSPTGVLRVTPAELIQMLRDGTAYIQVNTVLNPTGEIRGQIVDTP